MTTPVVTEQHLILEPVVHDTFIDSLAAIPRGGAVRVAEGPVSGPAATLSAGLLAPES